MLPSATLAQHPLRKPVRNVEGVWKFVDGEALRAHLGRFPVTAERNCAQAHSLEYEVYAIFEDCRVLVASVDPMAVVQGAQIFVPDAALGLAH